MKKLFLCALLLALTLPCAAQKEYELRFSSLINQELTLQSAIRLGLENNSEFLSAQQEIIIAEQKVKEAKFLFLPQLGLQGTATWYDLDYPIVLPETVGSRFIPNNNALDDKHQFFGAGITATQYLYAGGRFRNALKMAQANLKQAQSRYDSVKNATVLNVKKAFFRLLYAQQTAQFAAQIQQKAETYNRAFTPASWQKVKAQYLQAQLRSFYTAAEHELNQARLYMLASLNKELNNPIRVRGDFKPAPTVRLDLSQLNLWALQFRPELKTAIYTLELNNLATDLALSRRYPDLILTGSYERLGFTSLNDENKQISLAVRLPLLYNLSTQTAQRKAEQNQNNLRRAAIEDTVRRQVASSFYSLQYWQNETQTREQDWISVQNALRQAEKNQKHGLDALEALQAYYQTGLSYYQAIRDDLSAKAELEWAIGRDL